jgi:uncharacterized membrane protein HdeD (DUF308 family)
MAGVAFLILGILGLVTGGVMFGNVEAFAALAGVVLYLGGLILIIAGLVHFFKPKTRLSREVGIVGILLGIMYILLGSYATDPRGLSVLMGVWLILAGITSRI